MFYNKCSTYSDAISFCEVTKEQMLHSTHNVHKLRSCEVRTHTHTHVFTIHSLLLFVFTLCVYVMFFSFRMIWDLIVVYVCVFFQLFCYLLLFIFLLNFFFISSLQIIKIKFCCLAYSAINIAPKKNIVRKRKQNTHHTYIYIIQS